MKHCESRAGQPTVLFNHGIRRSGIYRFASMMLDECWVMFYRLSHLHNRQHTRLELDYLSDEQLRDIGISREASRREAAKWFWQD